MKVTCVLFMVFVSVVHPFIFLDIAAIVNKPVTLPCTCFGKEVKWSILHPTKESIAVCHHGMCRTEQRFRKRFSVSLNNSTGNFSMSITSAVYNDVAVYRCICENNSTDVKLNVYDPRIVKVSEGENVILPCYGDTRSEARDALWKKDGKTLLKHPRVITNESSASRFTMSEDGFQDGDLSLNISSARLSDAGLYLCLIHDESREGDPRAVLLEVNECKPEHQPPTPCSYANLALGFGLTLLVLVLNISYGIYWVRRYRGTQDATSTNPGPSVQEESPMIPKSSSTQPF